jgi:magnesium-transporting ATPase (P-type)
VVARALPSDKARLVRVSQDLGLVVGMTGDGINDAPSLKLADVGFAMGSGTDIAKAAADIVILDDSFEAIVKTVLYGRTIFKSIRKFISFQLMMNLTACGVSLIGQFIGFENPITIIQMLWVNIIMDTLGGLAFAGEPPLEYYMLEQPKSREEPILSRDMLHSILITGGYTLLICIMFMGCGVFRLLFRPSADNAYFLTGFYALFVFAGIFNCFNARSERLNLFSNIGKNKLFVAIMSLITLIQLLMVYFGGEIFRCAPLTFRELLNVVLLSSSVILFDGVRRTFKKLSSKSIEKS